MLDIIYDVQSVLLGILNVVELLLGISYVAGKYLIEIIIEATGLWYQLVQDIAHLSESSLQVLVNVAETILQSAFLGYYAIGHTADAFRITFLDLALFIKHVTITIVELTVSGFNLIHLSLSSLLTVPKQICSALSLIGDFFLGFVDFLGKIIVLAGVTVVNTPYNIVYALQSAAIYFFTQVINMFSAIPVSAHVGLVVVFLSYFVYCRFSLRLFFWSIFNLTRWGFAFGRRLLWPNRSQIKAKLSTNESNTNDKRQGVSRDSSGICVLCFENPVCYLASPCNHICVCRDCCPELVRNDNRCPLCRKQVNTYTRVYIS